MKKLNFHLLIRKFFCEKNKVISNDEAFKILGISQNTNSNEIRNAYLRLAKFYHPDINEESKEKFKEIQNAYDVVKNLKKDDYRTNKIENIIDNFMKTQSCRNNQSKKFYNDFKMSQTEDNEWQDRLRNNEIYTQKILRKLEKKKKKKFKKEEEKLKLSSNIFSKPNFSISSNSNSISSNDDSKKNENFNHFLNKLASISTYVISISAVSTILVVALGGKYGGVISLYIIYMTLKNKN